MTFNLSLIYVVYYFILHKQENLVRRISLLWTVSLNASQRWINEFSGIKQHTGIGSGYRHTIIPMQLIHSVINHLLPSYMSIMVLEYAWSPLDRSALQNLKSACKSEKTFNKQISEVQWKKSGIMQAQKRERTEGGTQPFCQDDRTELQCGTVTLVIGQGFGSWEVSF